MSEFALTKAERAFLLALTEYEVPFIVVGMGAALLEGAFGTTQDIDIWLDKIDGQKLQSAAAKAGGFFVSAFGFQPPSIGGEELDRIDLVLTAQGLDTFANEMSQAKKYQIDGVEVSVLPLERVIVSKKAANRLKDLAQLPALEAALAAKRTVGK